MTTMLLTRSVMVDEGHQPLAVRREDPVASGLTDVQRCEAGFARRVRRE